MNGQWKLVIGLVCILIAVSVFAVMTFVKNNDLQTQIKDQSKLELDNGLKDAKIKELTDSKTTKQEQEQDPETTVDQTELLEFLASYVDAQKSYIKILKQVMDNNGVTYPQFIYAELE